MLFCIYLLSTQDVICKLVETEKRRIHVCCGYAFSYNKSVAAVCAACDVIIQRGE